MANKYSLSRFDLQLPISISNPPFLKETDYYLVYKFPHSYSFQQSDAALEIRGPVIFVAANICKSGFSPTSPLFLTSPCLHAPRAIRSLLQAQCQTSTDFYISSRYHLCFPPLQLISWHSNSTTPFLFSTCFRTLCSSFPDPCAPFRTFHHLHSFSSYS